ncbi:hypothetical protein GCM10008908_03730 [Clostridium subterminale]|uniref:Uncharacterized protein n=1 Tax=Clostridium subterminale TaxID=1550 RepID=A0ABP3VUU5_CLOSU
MINVYLQTKCPNCERESYYVIDYSDYKHGLKCTCEYNYILDKTPIDIFRAWTNLSINNKIIDSIGKSKFPSSKEGIIYFYPSFIWFLVHDLKSTLFNTSVKAFLEIVKSKELPNNAIKFKVSLKHSTIPKFSDSIYDGYSFIMMNEYIEIIKGIAKHIRRKYHIKKNSINIYKSLKLYFFFDYFKDKLSSEELYYKNIDAEVFAYIMWRRDIEGHEDYDHIHTRKTNRGSDDPLVSIKVNITGTLFYKYVSNEFRMYFNSYGKNEYIALDDYGVLVDSFERILSNLLIRHYNNWVTYAINIKATKPNEIIDFKSFISPPLVDYVVQYNKNNQEAYLKIINIKN